MMEDKLGIVYLIETAQQFWSELEDLLHIPTEPLPTLSFLDTTLHRFLALCTAYHEQYLQSPLQLEHAIDLLLDTELFAFHSERMCEIIVNDTQETTNPHAQLISYHVLFRFGATRRPDFFRLHKRWQPLLPLLMDHVLVEIDPDVEISYFGSGSGGSGVQPLPAGVIQSQHSASSSSMSSNTPVPIEVKLRSIGVRLLYEVCRVQKLSVQDLRIFDDAFIDYLFDLVEQTKYMQDETFNYSVIKLIVALNEQFMVASLSADAHHLESSSGNPSADVIASKNRVLRVLMRRLGSSQTFGENMIFMLNRAQRTPEDLCMQLLVLKILYVLFTTPGTSEYFYTNDLQVLVDVFLRELVDLDEDSDSLRHTYLRVLHPLLTKTQLRDSPYKRPQIVNTLELLLGNSRIRDVNPTTKRLVDRCLSAEWCEQYQVPKISIQVDNIAVGGGGAVQTPVRRDSATSEFSLTGLANGSVSGSSPASSPSSRKLKFGASKLGAGSSSSLSMAALMPSTATAATTGTPTTTGVVGKTLKSSKSVEHLRTTSTTASTTTGHYQPYHHGDHHSMPPRSPMLDNLRRPSNASTLSFTGVATAHASDAHQPPIPPRVHKTTSGGGGSLGGGGEVKRSGTPNSAPEVDKVNGVSTRRVSASGGLPVGNGGMGMAVSAVQIGQQVPQQHRRRDPPAPPAPRRRKAPPIPVQVAVGGVGGGVLVDGGDGMITMKAIKPTSPLAR